nr:MAG TPA: Protein of unknown function (DUF1192) [Caudoviricetes sp.]
MCYIIATVKRKTNKFSFRRKTKMTIEEMKTRVAELKAEVARLDELTDDDAISDEEFDRLTYKANEIAVEYGRLQSKIDFLSVKNLTCISGWSASFLCSFECGTRQITNKQAEIFKRFNNGKPFIYNGRRFDCLGPNYRAGFASLVVTRIDI